MKLLQANIWGGRLQNQMIDFLKQEQADIICLQEAVSTRGDGLIFCTIEDMQTALENMHSFFSPVFDFNLMHKKAGFGNAVLSNRPFVKTETIFTRLTHNENFDFDTDDYNIRNLQHAVIELNGQPVHLLNHHGHHVHQHKNGDSETLRQCQIIADYIRGLNGEPVIVTGDFNLAPHSESIGKINALLNNLSVAYDLKTTRTILTNKTEVCDYVFVSDNIKVENFYSSEALISDHKALILEFSV